MNLLDEIKEVKRRLVEDGYANKLIDYDILKELHQKYSPKMDEKIFANEVLELKGTSYRNVKYGNKRRILKEENRLSKEKISEIREVILGQEDVEKKIDYDFLQQLHKKYAPIVTEKVFAFDVLMLTRTTYASVKNGIYNGTIRKNLDKANNVTLTDSEIEEIRQKLKERGLANKLINYTELQRLHSEYAPKVTERYFAENILEMEGQNYRKVKNGRKRRILSEKNQKLRNQNELDKETIIAIREKIKKNGFVGKSIDYEEFQKLHKEYAKNIPEKTFALEVLQCTTYMFQSIKNGKKAKILKNENKLSENAIIAIREKIVEDGFSGKSINDEDLKYLHEQYAPEITLREFAFSVLEMTDNEYRDITTGKKRKILKKESQLSAEKKREIVKKIEEDKLIGKKINYEKLKELHKLYAPTINEKSFAIEILGIDYNVYINMKSGQCNGIIKNRVIKLKTEGIKKSLKNASRYYTKEEIDDICNSNGITVEDFFKYAVFNFRSYKADEEIQKYLTILNNKGAIWIGNTRLSNSFFDKHSKEIYTTARIVLRRYDVVEADREDYTQELVIFALERCGEYEKNFEYNEDDFRKYLCNRMKYFIINHKDKDDRLKAITVPLTKTFTKSERQKEFSTDELSDWRVNIECQVATRITEQECIKRLKELIKAGTNRDKAFSSVKMEFEIDDEELLDIISNYLYSQKQSKDAEDKKTEDFHSEH